MGFVLCLGHLVQNVILIKQNQIKMKLSNIYLLVVFCLLLCSETQLWSQENTSVATDCVKASVQEKIEWHSDRNLYLTNETVYFKAHCFTNNVLSSPLSTVLYVELYNAQNQVFVQKKYALKEGVATGSFEVPTEIPTDYYYLRAYTRYLRNFSPEQYAHQVLRIINPKVEGAVVLVDTSSANMRTKPQQMPQKTISELKLSLNKSMYQPREQVMLNYDIPEEFVEASVSVHPVLAEGKSESQPFVQAATPSTTLPNLDFLPEINGLGITGVLRDAETQVPYRNVRCLISVVGKETQLQAAETDAEGRFTFHLQNLSDDQTVFIGTEQEKENTELLVFNDFSSDFAKTTFKPLAFDSLQHQLIEDMYLNQQLEKNFLPKAQEAVYNSSVAYPPLHNIGIPDLVIETDLFIDLPKMEDIFREIVSLVSMKGKVGSRILTVRNTLQNRDYDDPLILLDNVPVSDIEALLKLNPKKIERIEVIEPNYILGDYLFGGLIMIKTNTDNFAGYSWANKSAFIEYKTLTKGDVFKTINHHDTNKQNQRHPDFRTTLYWNPQPDLELGKVDFFTSDYCTEYEVVLRGFTKDGQYGEGRAVFSVERVKQ